MQRLLLVIFLFSSPLFAVHFQSNPSAEALGGLTILSQSLLDAQHSPLVAESGWALAYQLLYGMPEISVYTAATAFDSGAFHFSIGSSYLNHHDYQDFRPWLNGAYQFRDTALALGLNAAFDSITAGGSRHDFGLSPAIRQELWGGAIELGSRQIFSPSSEYDLSVKSPPLMQSSLAFGYTFRSEGGQIKSAFATQLFPALDLAASWQSNPGRFGIGLFIKAKSWKIGYGLRSHPRLNYSHSFSLESCW